MKKALATTLVLSGLFFSSCATFACDNNPNCNCNKPMMINLNDKLEELHSAKNEVQEIKTEVINQIKADEAATKNQIEEIKAQTEIQLKEVQQVLEQKTQEAVKEVEVQLEKTTNPDNLNVEIPATSVNTEEIKEVNEEVKTEIEQIKTDINEVKTEVEEAKAEIKDKIETVNPCNKENCKCEKCQCGEACNCENGCEDANCQCKNVQKVLDEANKAAIDGINKLFNLFRKK